MLPGAAPPGALASMPKRFPALANAPVNEERVCQYENSSNGFELGAAV